jgi:hypothetical protein
MNLKTILVGAMLVAGTSAQAIPFTVTWSGAQFGNTGSAIGHFDFTTAAAQLGGAEDILPFPSVDAHLIDLTITGTAGGDGTFTEADFAAYAFTSFTQLDFSMELIGQPLGNGFNFGDFGPGYGDPAGSGDFNLFGAVDGSPNGVFFFDLAAWSGEELAVVSMAPGAVPEPASWAMMVAGFGMMGFAMRRRAFALTA